MNVRLLHETLLASAERVPEREAVVAGPARLPYAELLDRSLRLARGLQELGVGRGDRVAIYMDNSAGCATAIYGTLLAGGVFVVVNPQTKADKLLYVLDDCEAAAVLTEGSLTRTALAAAASASSVKAVVADSAPEGVEGALSFEDVIATAEPEPRSAGTIPLDLAALIYTSGSTGFPKGVMMTHQSMVFAAGSISQYLRLGPDERILGLLPLAFDYGLYQLLMNVLEGGTLVLERSFAFPAQIVKRVQEEEATVFPGVPTVYATLLSMRRGMEFELPSVRRVTNTAAALPATFHGELARIFPNALVFAMYGLTECKRVSYLEPELLAEKPTSVGKAIPGTETDGAPRGHDAGGAGRDGRALRPRASRHGRVLAEARADGRDDRRRAAPGREDALRPGPLHASTRRASSTSSGGATTSSRHAARRSARSRWRTPSSTSRVSRRPRSSASRTRCWARRSAPSSSSTTGRP